MSSNIEIVITSDGSNSLHVKDLGENYHSSHGAIQEAKHVFIKNGLGYFSPKQLNVLEVGFGTGLNALLALDFAISNNITINYTGVETNLLTNSLISKLNYLEQLNFQSYQGLFQQMHEVAINKSTQLTTNFQFLKIQEKIQDFKTHSKFDVIFYDAFSPTSQIEMWDIGIFEKLYSFLDSGGFLVTYCAKGQLKRDLRTVGFEVESLPGPPGKREMIRAIKK
jgi:tRNA U34 5-methylaminomethyl-2-thiouridine-forming methyltransferase MnmC